MIILFVINRSLFHEAFFNKFSLYYLFFVYHELRNQVFMHAPESLIAIVEGARNQILHEYHMKDQNENKGNYGNSYHREDSCLY